MTEHRPLLQLVPYYLGLYRNYIAVCAAQALSFRTHFFLLVIVDLFFYASSFGVVAFLFEHVDMIGPWNRNEFLFFVSFFLAIDQLHMSMFAMSFWEFSADLRLGRLDFWLLKPAHVLFILFFRNVRFSNFFLTPVVWGALVYFGWKLSFGMEQWILLPLLILLGITLLVSIEILLSAAMFWTIESIGINFLRMQIQSVGRWPDFIYQYLFQKFFTLFVPILLVTSAPTHYLLRSDGGLLLLSMTAAIAICWVLNRYVWREGLKRYESASS